MISPARVGLSIPPTMAALLSTTSPAGSLR